MPQMAPIDPPPLDPLPPPWGPRFMLPVGSGDRALIVGRNPRFADDLRRDGVTVVCVDRWPSLPPAELEHPGFDHVFVPKLSRDLRMLDLADLGRVVRPGGGLFLGVPNRLRSRSPVATTPARGRRAVELAGFTDVEVFGLRHGLDQPRQLVPLDAPQVMAWYLASVYRPQPGGELRRAALLTGLVRTRLPVLVLGSNGIRGRADAGPDPHATGAVRCRSTLRPGPDRATRSDAARHRSATAASVPPTVRGRLGPGARVAARPAGVAASGAVAVAPLDGEVALARMQPPSDPVRAKRRRSCG